MQVGVHRLAVHVQVWQQHAECLELGREGETLPIPEVIERLFANAVAEEPQRLFICVVDGQCEHAVRPADHLGAFLREGFNQHLGVAGGAGAEA